MFIKMLERTRSVTAAARAVGLSRAGAHRFRRRAAGSLFASLWDHAVGRNGSIGRTTYFAQTYRHGTMK